MRKVTTFVGLTLFALAAPARAQEAAPTAAPPAGDKAATTTPTHAAAESAPPAGDAAAAAAPVAAPAGVPHRNFQVGLSFLPMALGEYTNALDDVHPVTDAAFAYGVGLSAGYEVLRGLIVGVAPQAIFNVQGKDFPSSAKQFDLMVRVAYVFPLADKTAVYAEFLPGYSLIKPDDGETSKGLVMAFGAGGVMDITDRFFANLGAGYQIGYQKQPLGDSKSKYIRVALGGGVKF